MRFWKSFLKIFVLFLIGSFFGYIIETIFAILKTGHFEVRQGLIYGPFIPVYGLGAIVFYGVLLYTQKPIKVFIFSIIAGGLLEYICSFVQEKAFGSISWDYSGTFLNLHGRINLQYSIYWGLIGLFFLKLLPFIEKIDLLIDNPKCRIIIYIIMAFMFIDIIISILALGRQYARCMGIEPQNSLDTFLDKHYTDEFIQKIYTNKVWVATPQKKQTDI